MKYSVLILVLTVIASLACNVRATPTLSPSPTPAASPTPTPFPTPGGPALSVVEYAKACYSAYEKTLNERGRSATQEQMREFISDLLELNPPRSLTKFHYAYLEAIVVTADSGLFMASKEWAEADAQIGQLDYETYQALMSRDACGFEEGLSTF